MPSIYDESFVLLLAVSLNVVVVALVIFSQQRVAPAIGLMVCAYGMFAYTAVPLLASDTPHFWYMTPPPGIVSRITLVAIAALSMACLWHARNDLRMLRPRHALALAAFIAAPPLLTLLSYPLVMQHGLQSFRIRIIFSILLSGYLFVALCTAYLFRSSSIAGEQGARFMYAPAAILLLVVTIVAILEVGWDIGPVRNYFRDAIETRASSVFHNPNWFALSVAPAAFLACMAAERNERSYALTLFALCGAALVLSGSRSVMLLLAGSFTVLWICLVLSTARKRSSALRILSPAVLGATLGIAALWATMAIWGEVPRARYEALLTRSFLWPFHIASDASISASIGGRISLYADGDYGTSIYFGQSADEAAVYGSSVVDNTYLYWLVRNPLAAVFLLGSMALLVTLRLRRWYRERCFRNALQLSAAVFVAGSGAIGQVYWAFPVWIVLAVLTGYALLGIVPRAYPQVRRPPPCRRTAPTS